MLHLWHYFQRGRNSRNWSIVQDQREIWNWSNKKNWSKGSKGEITETDQSEGEIENLHDQIIEGELVEKETIAKE